MKVAALRNKTHGTYKNKLHFFSDLIPDINTIENSTALKEQINIRVEEIQNSVLNESTLKQKYPALIKDYDTIRSNFNLLLEQLRSNKEDRQRLLLKEIYCLDLAFQLIVIAKSYSKTSHVVFYQEKIQEILHENLPVIEQQEYRLNDSADKAQHIEINPFAREFLETLNLFRLSFVYSGRFWNEISNLLGLPFNTGIFIDIADFSHVLNIGLFSTRFILNGLMICKHTFYPTQAEKNVTLNERFWFEIKKRFWMMVNDLVWTILHSLVTFSENFHISKLAVHWLLMGCIIFDVFWLGFKIFISERLFRAQEAKYLDELKAGTLSQDEIEILNAQLQYLRTCRYKNNIALVVSLSVELLFLIGFFLVHFITASFMSPVFCLICVIALALKLSSEPLSNFLKKRFCYEDTNNNLPKPSSENSHTAWKKFTYSLFENLLIPSLIVMLYAINWPAALLISIGYLAYKSCHQDKPDLESIDLKLC